MGHIANELLQAIRTICASMDNFRRLAQNLAAGLNETQIVGLMVSIIRNARTICATDEWDKAVLEEALAVISGAASGQRISNLDLMLAEAEARGVGLMALDRRIQGLGKATLLAVQAARDLPHGLSRDEAVGFLAEALDVLTAVGIREADLVSICRGRSV